MDKSINDQEKELKSLVDDLKIKDAALDSTKNEFVLLKDQIAK